MLGLETPIKEPLLNAQVTGQDSTMAAVYGGMIHWFWGDTAKPGYPLGHFGTSGAVSELPGHGGLDPSDGVDLSYYKDGDGFARPTIAGADGVLRWLDGLTVIKDGNAERLVGLESDHKGGFAAIARKLVVWNDEKNAFDVLAVIPPEAKNTPVGHITPANIDGVDYLLCGIIFPNVRVKADLKSFADLNSYEAFTCLMPGSTYKDADSPIDAVPMAAPCGAGRKTPRRYFRTSCSSCSKPESSRSRSCSMCRWTWMGESVFACRAARQVSTPTARSGWRSSGRRKGSSSYLGEIWFSEADRPEGPWLTARKIVTHNRYSLYNPVQYPFFEQDGGRLIYFSGTYATTFSRYGDPVPRYDYNNIMYRLDLADPRLNSGGKVVEQSTRNAK